MGSSGRILKKLLDFEADILQKDFTREICYASTFLVINCVCCLNSARLRDEKDFCKM